MNPSPRQSYGLRKKPNGKEFHIPANYWDAAVHYYCRQGAAWGVRTACCVMHSGLDRRVAAAIACLLNGDVYAAQAMLHGLPERVS